MTNCPNCGAARTGNKCEYCGTRFDEDRSREGYVLENIYIEKMLRTEELYRQALDAMRDYRRRF